MEMDGIDISQSRTEYNNIHFHCILLTCRCDAFTLRPGGNASVVGAKQSFVFFGGNPTSNDNA
jgi:hypothetical protein